MIFLDTSAIFALADGRDPNHQTAVAALQRLLEDGERLLLHNYVPVEAAAWLQARPGLENALAFLEDSRSFQVHWITSRDHEEATGLLEQEGRRGLGLVDCVSFAIMQRYEISHAFAFDSDFERAGFVLYRGPNGV